MSAVTVLTAAMLDAAVPEPPAELHPVRVMGRYLDGAAHYLPAEPRPTAVAAGALAWTSGAAASAAIGAVVERITKIKCAYLGGFPLPAGFALWPMFARRMLLDEVVAVESALAESVDAGRAAVSRLLSRVVSALTETQVIDTASINVDEL
jgi:adenosylcobinamide-phosphate synthase